MDYSAVMDYSSTGEARRSSRVCGLPLLKLGADRSGIGTGSPVPFGYRTGERGLRYVAKSTGLVVICGQLEARPTRLPALLSGAQDGDQCGACRSSPSAQRAPSRVSTYRRRQFLGHTRNRPSTNRWRSAAYFIRQRLIFGEAGEGHDEAVLSPWPESPAPRGELTQVGRAKIRIFALQRESGEDIPIGHRRFAS